MQKRKNLNTNSALFYKKQHVASKFCITDVGKLFFIFLYFFEKAIKRLIAFYFLR